MPQSVSENPQPAACQNFKLNFDKNFTFNHKLPVAVAVVLAVATLGIFPLIAAIYTACQKDPVATVVVKPPETTGPHRA